MHAHRPSPRLLLLPLLLLGLAACGTTRPPEASPPAQALAYCYQTLADVVCYTAPDPGRDMRLIGTYPACAGPGGLSVRHHCAPGEAQGPA